MDIFSVLTLVGGLALFLFGMNIMGTALEKRAGKQLKAILEKLTSNQFKGFLLGLGVTAIIQSSSATTVMVVGFVNSGVMTLRQAIGVIMGANLGTSVTSWILSLSGIQGDVWYVAMFKPTTFVPVLALVGVVLYAFQKNARRRDIGLILLGFSVLMYGMEIMSGAVAPLKDVPEFVNMLTLFKNPVLGVLVGVVFTAIIQSSSASVGILQALTITGVISYSMAIPIIMGQNIGTCVSAMISSIGATKNARRAAYVHLYFNIIATLIILPVFYIIEATLQPHILVEAADPFGIAVAHTTFKIAALLILMPFSKGLEKLAVLTVPEGKKPEETELLDPRLLNTPSVALEHCRKVACKMAEISISTLRLSMRLFEDYSEKDAQAVYDGESEVDVYEDKLGTYLVNLSNCSMTERDTHEVTKLLHIIGDLERISDHAVNLLESAQEMSDKKLSFSMAAQGEVKVLFSAINEIMDLASSAFVSGDMDAAYKVEPLEQIVDYINAQMKSRHIARLQKNDCTIELGFILSDMLTNLERVSDHCSNIAVCVIEIEHNSLDVHEYLQKLKTEGNSKYTDYYEKYKEYYALPE